MFHYGNYTNLGGFYVKENSFDFRNRYVFVIGNFCGGNCSAERIYVDSFANDIAESQGDCLSNRRAVGRAVSDANDVADAWPNAERIADAGAESDRFADADAERFADTVPKSFGVADTVSESDRNAVCNAFGVSNYFAEKLMSTNNSGVWIVEAD